MSPQDRPKIAVLIVAIVAVVGYGFRTFMNARTPPPASPPTKAAARLPLAVANGDPAPSTNPGGPSPDMTEEVAKVQAPPGVDPFRKVLPDQTGSTGQPAPQQPKSTVSMADDAVGGRPLPGVAPARPSVDSVAGVKLHGVVIEGEPLAVVNMSGQLHFLKVGEKFGDDFIVESVQRNGIRLRRHKQTFDLQIGEELGKSQR